MNIFASCIHVTFFSDKMNIKNSLRAAAICCFLICLTTGCGNNSGTSEYGFKRLYPNASDIDFDDFEIVELSKYVPMAGIEKIKVEDSLIFISSNHSLYSFNMDGSLNATYGMRGRASNEYLYLGAFYIDTNARQVCIIDDTQGKFLYFGYDGTFIRKVELDALKNSINHLYDVRVMADGRLFAHNMVYNDNGLLFSIIDLEEGTITDLKTVPFSTNNTGEPCGEHLTNMFNDSLYYVLPFDPTIYVLDNDKETALRKIPGVDDIPSERELKNITDYDFFKAYNMFNEGRFVGFTGLYETESFILLNILENWNYYIIDKNTGKQKRYSYSGIDVQNTLPIIRIKTAYQDWFIGVVEPMSLMQSFEDMPQKTQDPNLNKLIDLAGRTNIESNPCLLFYKIKSI